MFKNLQAAPVLELIIFFVKGVGWLGVGGGGGCRFMKIIIFFLKGSLWWHVNHFFLRV